MSIKSKSDSEFLLLRHVREKKTELTCVNEYFFDEHNAESEHYGQTLIRFLRVTSDHQTFFQRHCIQPGEVHLHDVVSRKTQNEVAYFSAAAD